MAVRRFIQCDVFSPTPTRGNPLAVVVDGDGIPDEELARFATWTNLAETTYLLPPTDPAADYRVRIFSPAGEMRFAGHPTLGSCAAWLHAGGTPRESGVVRQECGVGIVDIRLAEDGVAAFVSPPTEIRPMDDATRASIVDALAIPADAVRDTAELANGPVFQAFELSSAEVVLALDSARVRFPAFRGIGFIGAHPAGGECDYEVRLLAPASGMSEDPITGSLNASLAAWLAARGRLEAPITVAQGTRIGRHGRVYVSPTDRGVLIGGHAHVLVEGTVSL